MNSSSPESRRQVILVYTVRPENFSLLADLFGRQFDVRSHETFCRVSETYDLCLMDAACLARHGADLNARKQALPDVYLPTLGLLGAEATEALIDQFDDVIRIPCTKAELSHRVRGLLRARALAVTNRRLLERSRGQERRALNLSRELILLANSLPQIVWRADAAGAIDYVNDRWFEYVGPARGPSLNQVTARILHPDERRATARAYRAAIAGGGSMQVEVRLRRADNVYRWFLIRGWPLRDDNGHVVNWFGTCTDIEEQRAILDEAQSANRTKSAFLANMSHEIRTPLGIIIGFSKLLERGEMGEADRRAYLSAIIRNGQSLMTIIDDILDLAKVEAGRIVVEDINFSIFDLIDDCLAMFIDRAQEKGIYLRLGVAPDVPSHVRSDPTRVRQVLINLIGNAVKFTAEGGVHVAVDANPKADGGCALRVKIRDTGVGLSPEQRGRLFKPFVQADDSTTRRFGGTGLGLALSKKLAEALGGDIQIERCAPGEGSTFVFAFDTRAAGPRRDVAPGVATAALPSLAGLNILVVDDSEDNLFLVEHLLRQRGAVTRAVTSGAEALALCREDTYSCVLMDIQMPQMDGYAALAALRLAGFRAPILALTAHAMAEEQTRIRDAGFSAHVTKPIDPPALFRAIAGATGQT